MPHDVHRGLLDALGVSKNELPNENRGVGHGALPITRRIDYCPLCFIEDLRSRRTPYFRYQWTVPVYTHCVRHGTPLMTWRSVRGGDERVLPLRWVHRPKLSRCRECPCLGEDARTASAFHPSKVSEQSPFGLVRRLSNALVRFRTDRPGFELARSDELKHAVDALVSLGASTLRTGPLVNHLRPAWNPAVFGEPLGPYWREFFFVGKCWRSSLVSVVYRRSLLWYAARTLLGSSESQLLADGRIAQPCDGDRWLNQFIRPGTGPLEERLPKIESLVFAAREIARIAGI